jgi:hypothetical protein
VTGECRRAEREGPPRHFGTVGKVSRGACLDGEGLQPLPVSFLSDRQYTEGPGLLSPALPLPSRGYRLAWCWNRTELLQQTEVVGLDPLLCDFAIGKVEDVE